jgi:hypothetical protein
MSAPTSNQLDRLYQRMTAKERAKLRVSWWNEDRDDDPALRKPTPEQQFDEINAFISAALNAHDTLAIFVPWLTEKVETVRARTALVAAFHLWMLQADRLRWAIDLDLPEIITESEHASRLAPARQERFPV